MTHKRRKLLYRLISIAVALTVLFAVGASSIAQDDTAEEPATEAVAEETVTEDAAAADAVVAEASEVENLQIALDTTWVLLTAFLVFFMQAGFAILEAGFIRHTGVVNALLENFMDAGLTGLAFWAVGYGIAFGASSGGLFGTSNFFLSEAITFVDGQVVYGGDGLSIFTLFFFQFAFAATASTIATGGMAERTDFIGDIIYSLIAGAIIYPVVVHWVWGGGWL
ncbi:MAG: ammonium transporter, partial [Anaerolineae bacterium]|nr:ammonium transporter [Anaerolineae bacterium]